MGWFGKKLVVVSVMVGFRSMSVSRLDGFWIIYKTRKDKETNASVVFAGRIEFCICVCIWFMCVLIRSGCVLSVLYIITMSSTWRV